MSSVGMRLLLLSKGGKRGEAGITPEGEAERVANDVLHFTMRIWWHSDDQVLFSKASMA